MAKQVRKNSATGSNGVGGSNPSKTGNRAPGNAPAPGIPRHAGRKPVGTQFSRHALAALFPAECKDQAEMAKVMREDYQVALAETVIRANISAIPVRITTKSTDPRAKFLADYYQKLWDRHLNEMLECFAEGRAAFEEVWIWDSAQKVNRIKSLEHLPVAATEMLLTKENPKGKFDGISLKVPEDEAGEKGNAKGGGKGSGEKGGGEKGSDKGSGKKDGNLRIPPQNSWWLALDAKSTEPHGRSRFSGAPYRVYKRRAEVIRLRDIFIQKLVLQGGVAHVPENVIMENGVVLDVFEEMGKAHDERISGALMVLSNARDANGNYLYDITDPASTLDPAPLDNHLDGLDSEQLQAFGIPPKTITEGEAQGSFAMVSQQKLILDAVVEGILKQIEQSFQEFVLDRTVEYNFMKPAGVDLTISHEPLLSPENVIVAQLIEAIMTAPELPQIITSGAVDLMKILEKARIPLLPGAKAAIDKIFKAAQKMAEAGGVAGGGARSGDQGATSETGAGDGGVDGETPPENPSAPGVGGKGNQPPTPATNLANPHHDPYTGKFTTADGASSLGKLQSAYGTSEPHTADGLPAIDDLAQSLARYFIPLMRKIEVNADRGGLVGMAELRKASKMHKKAFDYSILHLSKNGILSLHRHNRPLSMDPDQYEAAIKLPPSDDGYTNVFHAVAIRGQGTAAKLIGLSNENQGAETSESGDKLDEKFNSDLNALTLALDAMSASYVTFA